MARIQNRETVNTTQLQPKAATSPDTPMAGPSLTTHQHVTALPDNEVCYSSSLITTQKEKGKNREVAQSSSTSLDDDFRVLLCLIEGDSLLQVKLSVDNNVFDLKDRIHEKGKHGRFSNVDAKDLVLWKLKVPIAIIPSRTLNERIQSQGEVSNFAEDLDEPIDKVSDHFARQPSERDLHIFVKISAATRRHRLEDLSAEEPSLKRLRMMYYESFPSDTPSNLAQPSKFKELQLNPDIQIFCNRPRSVTSNPITLLHSIFGTFDDDSKNSQPDPKISSFVLELATMMCEFYEEEADRVLAFGKLIWNHFSIKLEAAGVTGTKFTTDGHASVGFDVYLNTEGKNELASTAADPTFQSALYYHHHIRNHATHHLWSRFPCLHIFYFGPFLGFAGSVFSDHIHYEPLSPLISFNFSPHDAFAFALATRFFCAFRNATLKLQDYYKNLIKEPVPRSFFPGEARFPYPTTFRNIQTSVEIQFRLTAQPMPGRLGFLGTTEGDERPCFFIKFVRTYGLDLHRHCAELDNAPRLLGFEELPGGWQMVVMEFLCDHIPFSNFRLRSSISPQIQQLFMKLVNSFREKKFVHGDLQASNILVRDDAAGKLSMKLVDFDWGGMEGLVRYPLAINWVDIWRPDGAIDGELITAEHDLQMARHIFLNLP